MSRISLEFSEKNLLDIINNSDKTPAERFIALMWLNHVYRHNFKIIRRRERGELLIFDEFDGYNIKVDF